MLIEDEIRIDELRSLLEQMHKIDQAFERGESDALMKEADEYAEKKAKAWCANHGLEYNPADDTPAVELINAAVKRVRSEGKQ